MRVKPDTGETGPRQRDRVAENSPPSASGSDTGGGQFCRPKERPAERAVCVYQPHSQADMPKARAGIALALGHQSIGGNLRHALGDLMNAGLIECALPEKPHGRRQRCRRAEASKGFQ